VPRRLCPGPRRVDPGAGRRQPEHGGRDVETRLEQGDVRRAGGDRGSPQCGFSSTLEGNALTAEEQLARLRLIVETAGEVWGSA
jgi:hypothetical protein